MAGHGLGYTLAMTRDEAWQLVMEHTPSDRLRRHMLAVEACLRWYAAQRGADEDQWGVAGLLHDFDYELHPNAHPLWGLKLLEAKGTDPAIRQAIAAHDQEKTGVPPTSDLDRHLVACDELSGLVAACVYVRPDRSIHGLEVKSVLKKLKTPSFAAGVDRKAVHASAALIGLDLDTHIGHVITAMRSEAESLGLTG